MSEGRLLLLVLSSGSLLENSKAEAWVHQMLSSCFEELPEDSIVLTGGAPGPDTWACEAAENYGMRWVVYLRDGRRLDSTDEGATERRWAPGASSAEEHGMALIGALQKSKKAGWQVRVLALGVQERDVSRSPLVQQASQAGFEAELAVMVE